VTDSSADRDPIDVLAEEFVTRFRRGERPALTEYADRLPDRAAEVRELFPALVEMEQLKPVTADHTGSFLPAAAPSDPVRVGEFRILRRVGVGGMGVVYEAVQESLGRHVALKLMPIDALADPKRLERFRREAKAAAKLHHTNVVPVFGTGEADGRHFYAMQFIAGHPLDTVIDEVRRLKDHPAVPNGRPVSEVAAALVTGTFNPAAPSSDASGLSSSSSVSAPPALSGSLSDGGRHYWATVARVGAQVADALAYAHGQGVLHREPAPRPPRHRVGHRLRPGQGDRRRRPHARRRLRRHHSLHGPGAVRRGRRRSALGLTLYELLTLKPAFEVDTRAKLVEKVVAASPKPPRAVNPAIPRDLETIVLKAIQRDPARR
jgi:serine/threonine protein kinase